MTPIIEIRNLTKEFHGDHVLKAIDLDVRKGEFLTLLGPSGCGKTTLLRIISGFEMPTSGSLVIQGKSVKTLPPHLREVNTVFQSYALFPHMTVFDNVAFGLRCKGVKSAQINERVNDILASVRLEHLGARYPKQLSGGQQQRVAMARAVVNKPLVLLLDEPLSALDYSLRQAMQIELKNLQQQLGITFIFVTHDQEEALSMSDRIVVMDEGVIQQIGTPRQVYETPGNLRVAKFVGAANIFEVEVIKASETSLEVKVENQVFQLQNRKNFQTGQSLSMVVRPEDLRVWDKKEMQERENKRLLPATVEQVIYKGSTVDLVLKTQSGKRLAATEFFDEDDADLDYRRGESVWIEWMSGWEVLLPVEQV